MSESIFVSAFPVNRVLWAKRVWVGGALSVLVAASPAVMAAPQLTVAQILQRNAQARGGLAAWEGIQSMVQIGLIDRQTAVGSRAASRAQTGRIGADADQAVQFRLILQKPNKMRMDLTYRGATAIQAFDGSAGYTVEPGPNGAIARPFTTDQVRAAASQQGLDGPLLDAAADGTVVTLAGVEPVDGRPAYQLILALKNGATRHVWVDCADFLDVKIDGTRVIGGHLWPIETTFGEFRTEGKVTVPHEIRTSIDGVHTMERMRILRVVLNAPLEASLFTLPRAPGKGAGTAH